MSIATYLKIKSSTYVLTGALVLGSLTGCKEVKTETSEVLHEEAVVITRIYTPSRHETKLSLIPSGGIPLGHGLEISSSTVPEKYGAVFRCQHGTFTSQGSDKRHKDLHDKLQEGQEVDITYREVYRSTYDDIDGKGKKDLVERVLTGFDFLDANPKSNKISY